MNTAGLVKELINSEEADSEAVLRLDTGERIDHVLCGVDDENVATLWLFLEYMPNELLRERDRLRAENAELMEALHHAIVLFAGTSERPSVAGWSKRAESLHARVGGKV